MIKQTFILLAVIGGLAFVSCNNAGELDSGTMEETTMKNFSVPDSINKELVIAMFEEAEPVRRTLLVYDSEERTAAKKISYFANGRASIEELVPKRYNEFNDPASRTDYVVKEKTILSCYTGQSNLNIGYNWSSDCKTSLVREYNLIKKLK